jgi:hypothetical protein
VMALTVIEHFGHSIWRTLKLLKRAPKIYIHNSLASAWENDSCHRIIALMSAVVVAVSCKNEQQKKTLRVNPIIFDTSRQEEQQQQQQQRYREFTRVRNV